MANYPFIMLACVVAQSSTEIARQSVTLEFVTQGLLFTVIPGVGKVLITPHIDEARLSKNVPAWQVMIMPFEHAAQFIRDVVNVRDATSTSVAEGNENGKVEERK